MWLLIAFIAVPLIEIALFIQVGGAIGLWSTLAIVLITAIAGTWLVRSQGSLALRNLQSSFSELRDPTDPLIHGAMILFAGALLLTPGFFTDAVGFSLLIPGVRRAAVAAFRARVNVKRFDGPGDRAGAPHQRPPYPHSDVIDGEYEEVDAPANQSTGPSGWTKH